MSVCDRYENERAFTDGHAARRLSSFPKDLKILNVEPFENLCAGIDYLKSVPDFFGDISRKKVLEMGCGDGWISLRLAKSGVDVWACDISPKMIQLAKRYAEAADLNIEFDTMVCEEMSYGDDFFDLVFMHFALHHCDIDATARQIRRVLKPGGKAVLVEDYAYHPLLRLYRLLTPARRTKHERPLTRSDLSTFVSEFSSCVVEHSGLLNIFETSRNKHVRLLLPLLRSLDGALLENITFLRKYSRIVIIKAVK